jgi:hypothetical protein
VARIQCPNPQCKGVLTLTAEQAGKRVRCKLCGKAFVARPHEGVQPAPGQNPFDVARGDASASSSPPRLRLPPLPAENRPAKRSAPGIVWVLLAVLVFLVPVAGAGTFAALNWRRGLSETAGERFAAMQLGSKGVSIVLFEAYPDEEHGTDFQLLEEDSRNTDLADELGKTGSFSEAGLKRAAEVVKQTQEALIKDKKVPPGNIFLVGSAGLLATISSQRDLSPAEKNKRIAANKRRLSAIIEETVGLGVDFIDQHDEAQYEIEGLIRSRDLDVGMYIKVGSGETRGGYVKSGVVKPIQISGLNASRNHLLALEKRSPDEPIANLAARLGKDRLRPELRKEIAGDPELLKRSKVYLVGGMTWVMATCRHPKKCVARRGTYVKLSVEDIEEFRRNVTAERGHYLHRYKQPRDLTAAEEKELSATLKKQIDFFKAREDLVAGAEILYALAQELELENKTVWFHRHGHVVWMQSYIEEHAGLK